MLISNLLVVYFPLLPTTKINFARSKAIAFLGYPYGYKGYKLLVLEPISAFISRNILLHEGYKRSELTQFPSEGLAPLF